MTGAHKTVVVVGLGNIGSHVVPHVARLPAVGRLVLCDPDTYDASNVASQAICAGDVGLTKAEASDLIVRRGRWIMETLSCGTSNIKRSRRTNVEMEAFYDALGHAKLLTKKGPSPSEFTAARQPWILGVNLGHRSNTFATINQTGGRHATRSYFSPD